MGTIVHGTILWIYGLSTFKQTWQSVTLIHRPLGLFRSVSIRKNLQRVGGSRWFKHRHWVAIFGCLSSTCKAGLFRKQSESPSSMSSRWDQLPNRFQMCFTNPSTHELVFFLRSTHHPASQVSKLAPSGGFEENLCPTLYSRLEQCCIKCIAWSTH